MDIAILKKKLIDKIQTTKSNALLEEINLLLSLEESSENDVYQLNEEEQNAIAKGREDIKNGRYLTDKEASEDIQKWLKK
ncbi:hypothetical protein [Mariniflexile sp.]|uniref:hypothetical protein n=1 Tax=Mariniflexile sp. TaxID=1979402 RepID=UPI0040473D83